MDMDTINFIEKVKKYPELYDLSHLHYLNPKWKDQLWENIASELNIPNGKTAKNRWRKLRECHREALRRQEKKLELNASYPIRPWIYQKQMEFLRSHMRSGSNAPEFTDQTDDENSSITIVKEEMHLETVDDKSSVKRLRMSPADESFETQLLTQDYDPATSSNEESNPNETLMQEQLQSQDKSLGLYHFFMSMYNITKNLPVKAQRQVRRTIFETVSAAEEAVEDAGVD